MNNAISMLYIYRFNSWHIHNISNQIFVRNSRLPFAQVVERFIIENDKIRTMNEGDR